ncbi:MAG: ferrochelatase [Actinomycetota bacterium]
MIGVLLLGFGGPDSLEAVEPFLRNLTGRKISPAQLEKTIERYKLIGGRSPLLDITRKQAEVLEKYLNADDGNFKVYIGMRYWHPFIKDTLEAMVRDGVSRIIALSLSPFESRTTTGAYFAEVERALSELGVNLGVTYVSGWYNHPLYIDAVGEKVEEGLAWFGGSRGEVQIIFSVHSLPQKFIEEGDPYVEQVEQTVRDVVRVVEPVSWHLAFQSRGGGPGEWLEPEVNSVLEDLVRKEYKKVLLVPIGFVSDHIETLYDIDIVYRKKAESLGMTFHRSESLNASPKFVDALTQIVVDNLQEV